MASRKDYYDILGVRRGATEEEIEKAYQRLARTYQSAPPPGNKIADFRFKEILEAYEILSNKAKRERYDRIGIELPLADSFWGEGLEEMGEEEEGSWEGFEDLFPERFEDGGPAVPLLPQRGNDLHCRLEIDLESAIGGTMGEVQFLQEALCFPCSGEGVDPQSPQKVCDHCGGAGQVQIGLPPSAFTQTCRRCQGAGRVRVQRCKFCDGQGSVHQEKKATLRVPPGVDDGCRIYLMKMGQRGKNGGPNGDLVVEVKVKPHPYFGRKGDDLHIEVPLAVWEAALGTEVEVPTLTRAMRVKVPPVVQSGDQFRLQGQGALSFHGDRRGDLVISYKIVIPQQMDAKAREVWEELRQKNPGNPRRGCGWPLKS